MQQGSGDPRAALLGLINGFQASQAICVAARLGIADLLRDGARSSEELARAMKAHPEAVYRLLRALASVGVFREEADRRFTLTPLGERLRTDAPDSLSGWAAFIGEGYYWQSWGNLLHSVTTGENAFRHLHGTDIWSYRAADPEATAVFDAAMTSIVRGRAESVVEAYDFGRFSCIVDVGGGHGRLLATILARYPSVRGILFDQAHVVAGAQDLLRPAGVSDRCEVIAGSFFDAVPPGGDAYLMSAILHDWENEQAEAILRTCRQAMNPEGTLLVIERELGPPNQLPPAKFSDLNMLVMPGGRERTREEYAALFAAAGFSLKGVTATAGGVSLIEGVPA